MQERRMTIRVPHQGRTQYCPSEDFLPRDGRLTTLSERGAGLLTREAHPVGGQVTISFSLPQDPDLLTATGIIRWSEARSANGRWYPLGLEWLTLEDTTRHRLHRFLYNRTIPSAGRSAAKTPRLLRARPAVRRIALLTSVIIGVLAGVLAALWALSLESENRRFDQVIAQRNTAIQRLRAREAVIQHDLEAATAYLATSSWTVSQLDAQARRFQDEVQQLNQDVARFQASYGRALREREQLIEQALILQQERLLREKPSNSPEELRLAIREAIANRQPQTDSGADR